MPRFLTNNKWYGWSGPEKDIQSARRQMLLLAGVNVLLSLGTGVLPTGVTRHNWVSFAATAALVALATEIIGIIRFFRAKGQMVQREFEGVDHFIRLSCLFHILLMAVAVLSACVSCFQHFSGIFDILAILGLLLSLGCSLAVLRIYRALPTFEMESPV